MKEERETHPLGRARQLNKPYIYWHMREVYESTIREAIRRGTSIELDIAFDESRAEIYVGHPKEYYAANNLPAPSNVKLDIAVEMLREAENIILVLDCKHQNTLPKIKEVIERLGVGRCIVHSFIKEWSTPYPRGIEIEAHWESEDVPYAAIKSLIDITGVKTIGALHALSEERINTEGLLDRAISMAQGFESISIYLPGTKVPAEKFLRKIITAGYLPWINQDEIKASLGKINFNYIGMTDNPNRATINNSLLNI